ncbi:hypothetical protein Mapa_008916 [Marchantia paleacea]|nr:hypothetical protein Mapa_008916 [Marchantia paleacea]
MQRGQLFITLALELYRAMYTDFDMFVRECARAYHSRRYGISLCLDYCITYFSQRYFIVFIVLRRALAGDVRHISQCDTIGGSPMLRVWFHPCRP